MKKVSVVLLILEGKPERFDQFMRALPEERTIIEVETRDEARAYLRAGNHVDFIGVEYKHGDGLYARSLGEARIEGREVPLKVGFSSPTPPSIWFK